MFYDLVIRNGVFGGGLILFTIFSLRALAFAGGSQLWTQRAAWPKSRLVVKPFDLRTDSWRDVKRGALVLALDAAAFAVVAHYGWFRAEATETAAEILAAFAGYFAWFEVYFYFSHRALHHPKLFWIHRFHHEGRGTNPWTSLAFSVGERAVLLAGAFLPVFALYPLHPVAIQGFGFYFLLNYLLNVYGHMNVEIAPAWLSRLPIFPAMSTSVSHSLHHLRFKGHYGLFTRVLDQAFGTDFADYPEIFDRVVAGRGALKG